MNTPLEPIVHLTTGVVRGTVRRSGRLTRSVAGRGLGALNRVRPGGAKSEMDDVTLARKVETEIFRGTRGLKSNVDVNAVDAVVHLRGEVKRPEQIRDIERRTRRIPEVRDVENLLHLSKTPAPTRADTPRRAQRTGTARRQKSERPTTRRRAETSRAGDGTGGPGTEKPLSPPATPQAPRTSVAEPAGRELAEKGAGRQPAPLGSTANETTGSGAPGGAPSAPSATRPEPPEPSPAGAAPSDRPEAPSAEPHAADQAAFTTRVQEELKRDGPGSRAHEGDGPEHPEEDAAN